MVYYLAHIGALYGRWPFAVCTNPDHLRIEAYRWETPFFLFRTPRSGGRAGDRLSAHSVFSHLLVHILHIAFFTFGWSTGPGRHPLVFVVKFQVECTNNMSGDPLGPEL